MCQHHTQADTWLTPSSIITESIKSASMEELCRRCLLSGDKDTGVFLPQARNKKCKIWFVMKFRTTLNLPGFRFHYPYSRRVWQSKKFCQLRTHNIKNSGSFQHASRWEVSALVKLSVEIVFRLCILTGFCLWTMKLSSNYTAKYPSKSIANSHGQQNSWECCVPCNSPMPKRTGAHSGGSSGQDDSNYPT